MIQHLIINKVVSISLVILFVTACSSTEINQTQPTKTGLQLWSENCAFCHNYRAIDSYSDAQWDVAMMHMRIRANLTADDARAITKYLKSAN